MGSSSPEGNRDYSFLVATTPEPGAIDYGFLSDTPKPAPAARGGPKPPPSTSPAAKPRPRPLPKPVPHEEPKRGAPLPRIPAEVRPDPAARGRPAAAKPAPPGPVRRPTIPLARAATPSDAPAGRGSPRFALDATPKKEDAEILNKKYRHYSPRELLGRGACGEVFKMEQIDDGKAVAVKLQATNSWTEANSALEEARKLTHVRHENVLSCLAVFIHEDPSSGVLYVAIVTEFAELGTLAKYRSRVFLSSSILDQETKQSIRKKLIGDIAAGLKRLHEEKIMHRDLKPDNILLSGTDTHPVAKLADFGLARDLTQLDTVATAGTPFYMSPEQRTGGSLSEKVDIFAFGVISIQLLVDGDIWSLFNRTLPADWLQSNSEGFFAHVRKLLEEAGMEKEWYEPIAEMLQKAPTERPTIAKICKMFDEAKEDRMRERGSRILALAAAGGSGRGGLYRSSSGEISRGRAVKNYKAKADDQLSVSKGDILVLRECPSDPKCWLATLKDHEGLVPRKCVEQISAGAETKSKSSPSLSLGSSSSGEIKLSKKARSAEIRKAEREEKKKLKKMVKQDAAMRKWLRKETNLNEKELRMLREKFFRVRGVESSETELTPEQFKQLITQCCKVSHGEEEINWAHVLRVVDTDDSGTIGFEEVARFLSVFLRGSPEDKLTYLFKRFDKSSGLVLQREDILQLLELIQDSFLDDDAAGKFIEQLMSVQDSSGSLHLDRWIAIGKETNLASVVLTTQFSSLLTKFKF